METLLHDRTINQPRLVDSERGGKSITHASWEAKRPFLLLTLVLAFISPGTRPFRSPGTARSPYGRRTAGSVSGIRPSPAQLGRSRKTCWPAQPTPGFRESA